LNNFRAVNPQTGEEFGPEIANATKGEVSAIIEAAHAPEQTPALRASLLRNIAVALEEARPQIVPIAQQESGLPEARINGELTRTVFQVNLFAAQIATGRHLDPKIDLADANYPMGARPDIRKENQPLGTVAIFAASNFPLAFSTAGGDSISALAAGCAVVLKAHPSHPQTSRLVFAAIQSGIEASGQPKEIFSMVEGNDPQITHWVASHPKITAIGFTGSGGVGKLLMDLAAKREVPIPVFAEMGSINPVFVTSSAISQRNDALVKGAVDSALLGSGQFCTKPGLFVIPKSHADLFLSEMEKYLATISVGPLLNQGIAERYSAAITSLAKLSSVKVMSGNTSGAGIFVTPTFFIADWSVISAHPQALEEHFGPTTVIAIAEESQYEVIASALEGQLTATIHGSDGDSVAPLLAVLAEKAGRVIWNAFPTGVSVTAAMQHGGQWPSSSSHTTSVGTDAIYRFMRPVSYQGMPDSLLPDSLKDSNPLGLERLVNGVRTKQ
jgi:NADP-dependent aldehyde dehydrogenase